jgi:hypothetical protein
VLRAGCHFSIQFWYNNSFKITFEGILNFNGHNATMPIFKKNYFSSFTAKTNLTDLLISKCVAFC